MFTKNSSFENAFLTLFKNGEFITQVQDINKGKILTVLVPIKETKKIIPSESKNE